jgi:predicted ArsR family transcriptional regulator
MDVAGSPGGTMAPAIEGTRQRILLAIRGAEQPPTVAELASALEVHHNTVRQHVATLEADGLVARDRRPTGGKGRPRTAYRVTPLGRRSGRRNYELLARVLVERLATGGDDATQRARDAGRSWGRQVATSASGPGAAPEDLLLDVLDEEGFDPVPRNAPGGLEVSLRNCPFRELADSHGDLVCSLHEGLVDGLVNGADDATAGGVRVELVPFATAATCLVRVASSSG